MELSHFIDINKNLSSTKVKQPIDIMSDNNVEEENKEVDELGQFKIKM